MERSHSQARKPQLWKLLNVWKEVGINDRKNFIWSFCHLKNPQIENKKGQTRRRSTCLQASPLDPGLHLLCVWSRLGYPIPAQLEVLLSAASSVTWKVIVCPLLVINDLSIRACYRSQRKVTSGDLIWDKESEAMGAWTFSRRSEWPWIMQTHLHVRRGEDSWVHTHQPCNTRRSGWYIVGPL